MLRGAGDRGELRCPDMQGDLQLCRAWVAPYSMRQCSCRALRTVLMQIGQRCPASITVMLCLQAVESVLLDCVHCTIAVRLPAGHHSGTDQP